MDNRAVCICKRVVKSKLLFSVYSKVYCHFVRRLNFQIDGAKFIEEHPAIHRSCPPRKQTLFPFSSVKQQIFIFEIEYRREGKTARTSSRV